MMILLAVCAGLALDCLFGDPPQLPHPVRLMGWTIKWLERATRRIMPATARGELIAGGITAVLTIAVWTALPWAILLAAARVHWALAFVLEAVMCYQALALKDLRVESMRVHAALERDDLSAARQSVAMIVGRDTAHLDETQVIKAAVETVAENTSDGIIAPLCYLLLGGAPLGFGYKAVNTLDSMIGYRNERYLYFGRLAARLDDAANFIPARLAALLMLAAGALSGLDGHNGWRVYRRDRRQHASPNSAHTEAACAGLLRVQLAGDAYYFGQLHHKPMLGDALRPVELADIQRANQLAWKTAALTIIVLGGLRLVLVI